MVKRKSIKKDSSPLQVAQQQWATRKGRILGVVALLNGIARELNTKLSPSISTTITQLNYYNDAEFIKKGGTIPRKE